MNEQLSKAALELIAHRFRILADPMRLLILYRLGGREMSVTQLVEITDAGQANVSKHLGVMLKAGIVARRKEGVNAIYRVADKTIFELCEVVCSSLRTELEGRQNALSRM